MELSVSFHDPTIVGGDFRLSEPKKFTLFDDNIAVSAILRVVRCRKIQMAELIHEMNRKLILALLLVNLRVFR